MSKKKRRHFINLSYNNLKEGGKLILTTSNIFQNWRFIFNDLNYKHNYYYFPNEIKYWFEDIDFVVDKIKVNDCNLIVAKKIK